VRRAESDQSERDTELAAWRRRSVRRQSLRQLANPGIKHEIHVGESLGSHDHIRSLRSDADRLIRNHDVGSWCRVDQKVTGAVTRKPDHAVAILLEGKPRLEWCITWFTLATDGLDRAEACSPLQPSPVESAGARRTLRSAGSPKGRCARAEPMTFRPVG
jgi:hypothetical protein